jgi:protein phosphatase
LQILGDLNQGKIQTIAQLRSRLEEIATELEAPTTATFHPMEEQKIVSPTTLRIDELEEISAKTDDLPTVVLSMQLSSLEDAGRTDVGRQRHHNEDCFGIETKIEKLELPKNRVLQARGLYVLCDGMGGHAGGEVASQLAVNTLRKYFQERWIANQLPTEDSIREAVYLANQAIYEINQQDARSGVGRMGTTLVMLLLQGNQAAVAHVGDSRLYRVTRKRGLEQVTVDHEVGQREILRGVEANIAYARPDAYQLTQALGPRDQNSINPDVEFFDINEDSLLLLASDGLSDNDLLEIHWQTHLIPLMSSGVSLERGVTELIDLANQYNGHDNITAILVRAKVRPNMEGSRE